jgi:NADPH:quinone reductase-like Zn-dependent oxidoreductase
MAPGTRQAVSRAHDGRRKPQALSFEEAATVAMAGFTALQGLRDKGRIRAGDRVLINGASGGVGTFAVQLAKYFGAEVTAVCGGSAIELMRALGADEVIDYTREDVGARRGCYDVVLDAALFHRVTRVMRVLKPRGRYVVVGGSVARVFQAMFLAPFLSRRRRGELAVLSAKANAEDLRVLAELLDAGSVKPVIDSTYPLARAGAAIQHVETGHPRGKVIIVTE